MSLEPDAVARRIAARDSVARLNALLWGSCAVVCFALSAYLTRVVVHGDYKPLTLANTQIFVPFVRRADVEVHNVTAQPAPPPGFGGLQTAIGSSPPPGTIDTYRMMTLSSLLYVNFRSEGNNAVMSVKIPSGLDVRFVMNHLLGTNPCTLSDQDQANPTTLNVTERSTDERQIGRVWLVSLSPTRPRDILIPGATVAVTQPWVADRAALDAPLVLDCKIDLPAEWETFASRRLGVAEPTLHDIDEPEDAPPGLADYLPVGNIGVNFEGLSGLEGLQFIGGFSFVGNPTVESPEQWRTIRLGSNAEVTWHDLGREGQRDEILVIIGALIAIGAAMAVEAVRPYIERYVEAPEKAVESGSVD